MAKDRCDVAALPEAVQRALAALTPQEMCVFTLGVLHGVPLRQLPPAAGWTAEAYQETLIGAVKAIRRSLGDAGFSSDAILDALPPAPRH